MCYSKIFGFDLLVLKQEMKKKRKLLFFSDYLVLLFVTMPFISISRVLFYLSYRCGNSCCKDFSELRIQRPRGRQRTVRETFD